MGRYGFSERAGNCGSDVLREARLAVLRSLPNATGAPSAADGAEPDGAHPGASEPLAEYSCLLGVERLQRRGAGSGPGHQTGELVPAGERW
ncbi:hypothetical protein ACIHAR_34185 [Streptomyces sp. NPDC052016]|uniref:hypothetical protein n=1 Tax=Streptomyces sp. NPDC052016 TaxID=3365680 RepID=UPI0037D1EF2E